MRFALAVIVVLAATAAFAHSWYPQNCCSGKDCAPLDSLRVKVTLQGYIIDGRHHVQHGQALWSPDENYHGCFPTWTGPIGCFWAPRPAM